MLKAACPHSFLELAGTKIGHFPRLEADPGSGWPHLPQQPPCPRPRLAPKRQRCGRGVLVDGPRPPWWIGVRNVSSAPPCGSANDFLPRPATLAPAAPQASLRLLWASPDFVLWLGHALKSCRISPAPPCPQCSLLEVWLQADVMSNFTGKSSSPRLSLTENSRSWTRRGSAARTPQRMLRRCPASSAQATNWLSEAGGEGSKRAEEMGLERVGVGDWKAPIIK